MLHYETIEPATLELLRQIEALPGFADMRLVGGTALALQFGHRKSVDLDFFGSMAFDSNELEEALRPLGTVVPLKKSMNINIYLVNGIKIDVVNYSYAWLEEVVLVDGLRLASQADIAAMKVNAVIGRGTRKDFIDIAYLLRSYSLSQILRFYFTKYPEASVFLASKSLAYYADADKDPMPVMFSSESWEEIKAFISSKYDEYEQQY